MTPLVEKSDALVKNYWCISFGKLDHIKLRVMHRWERGDAYLLDGGYHWSKNGVQWSKILCTCLLTNLIILE